MFELKWDLTKPHTLESLEMYRSDLFKATVGIMGLALTTVVFIMMGGVEYIATTIPVEHHQLFKIAGLLHLFFIVIFIVVIVLETPGVSELEGVTCKGLQSLKSAISVSDDVKAYVRTVNEVQGRKLWGIECSLLVESVQSEMFRIKFRDIDRQVEQLEQEIEAMAKQSKESAA